MTQLADRPGNEPVAPGAPGRHEVVRQANVEVIFKAIVDLAPVSRSVLVKATGLSKPTVLRLVAALESEGLIRRVQLDSLRRGAGRIPISYEPNPTAAYVVGVDVGGTKTAVALADLTGSVVAEVEDDTTNDGGQALVRQVARLARALTRGARIPWSSVAAITVGTPGVENPDGTIRLADNIPGLGSVPVASRLRRSLRIPVQLENDVNLAALGELEVGVARTCRTFALLALGTGVGLGLVIDGQLARGARGAAGEVAYLPIGGDPATAEARRRGAFELAASGSGLTHMLNEELSRPGNHGGDHAEIELTPASSARDIYAAADAGNPVAWRVIERQADVVARVILSVACVIDPELIVLGGGIGANPLLLGPVKEALEHIMPWPVPVESSALGSRSGVIGAVHHARRSLPRLEAATVSARIRST